jgi:hypothetical protein
MGRGVHGESTSSLTGTRATVWSPVDGGEETAEEALSAERREGEWGEVRWRTAELSLYIVAEGEGGSW